MTERRSSIVLLLALFGLAALVPALAFMADASAASVLTTEGVLTALFLGAAFAHARGTLSQPLRRSLISFGLCAVCSFGAYTFQMLENDEQAGKWWTMTHATCLRGEPESLLDLFLIGLCPLGFFIDLVVSVARVFHWLAEQAVPVLYLGAAAALASGVHGLLQHRRGA